MIHCSWKCPECAGDLELGEFPDENCKCVKCGKYWIIRESFPNVGVVIG